MPVEALCLLLEYPPIVDRAGDGPDSFKALAHLVVPPRRRPKLAYAAVRDSARHPRNVNFPIPRTETPPRCRASAAVQGGDSVTARGRWDNGASGARSRNRLLIMGVSPQPSTPTGIADHSGRTSVRRRNTEFQRPTRRKRVGA